MNKDTVAAPIANAKHQYRLKILEEYVDFLGHVHHANYLILFEQARWDWITQNGYGLKEMQESQIGPVILELNIKYRKELRVRQEVLIESHVATHQRLMMTIHQEMLNTEGDLCSTIDLKMGCLDLRKRKLVLPPENWTRAVGIRD